MTRRLILHVGDCKTGSTILQTMLARGDCEPQGGVRLHYPGNAAHGPLARGLGDRPQLYPARWENMARRLAAEDWDVAVLSSELFEFIRPERVAQALDTHFPALDAQLTVVAYIRPHMSRALSQFAENIKLGHETGGFADFAARFRKLGRLRYADRLAGWRETFGERLVVRPFLRDRLAKGDVRHDFLSLVLAGAPYRLRDSGQDDNAALPVADLALMRWLQRRFAAEANVPVDNRVAFGKRFGQLLRDHPSPGGDEKLRLPRAIFEELLPECRADAERMDAEWFGGPCFVPELERAAAELSKAPQSLEATEHFSAESLRLTQAWAELILRQMPDSPKEFGKRLRPPP